jgi:hypothetical protein
MNAMYIPIAVVVGFIIFFVIIRNTFYINLEGEISVITDSSDEVVEVTGQGIYRIPRGVRHLMHEVTLYYGRVLAANITEEPDYVYFNISLGYEIDYSKDNPKILELFKKYNKKVYYRDDLFFEPAREKLRSAISKYKTLEEASGELGKIERELYIFLVEEGKKYNISIENFRLTIK